MKCTDYLNWSDTTRDDRVLADCKEGVSVDQCLVFSCVNLLV